MNCGNYRKDCFFTVAGREYLPVTNCTQKRTVFARYKSAVDKLALAMCLPLSEDAITTIKIHTYENNNGCKRTDHPAVLCGAADSGLRMIQPMPGK